MKDTCPCCKRKVEKIELRSSYIANGVMCTECMYTWYDLGITDPKKIGEETLKRLSKKELENVN